MYFTPEPSPVVEIYSDPNSDSRKRKRLEIFKS